MVLQRCTAVVRLERESEQLRGQPIGLDPAHRDGFPNSKV